MNLAKTYTPNDYEPTIYALWEQSGVFDPKGVGEPYAIVMPPPNANGNLHVGHALSFDLEDILVRFFRMKGRDAVLIPGADHAGFETWVVYERELEKQGKTRFDFSHNHAVTAEELGKIEAEVNAFIRQNTPVETRIMTPDDARAIGAQALFGEKYGDEVRVVSMGKQLGTGKGADGQTYSLELCGGSHVGRTGDIGMCATLTRNWLKSLAF